MWNSSRLEFPPPQITKCGKKSQNVATQKRKLNPDQCRNLEQHRAATQKTQANQPEKKRKKEKPRTSTQKTLTDPKNTNPQQKIFQDGRWRENKK